MSSKNQPSEQVTGFDATVGDEMSAEQAASEQAASERSETEQLREELAMANDRALRAAAELENFRRRSRQQIDAERRYAAMPLIQSLLPALDNIDRAIGAADGSDGAGALIDGFKIVASQMRGALAEFDCIEIEALGQTFDPNWHDAILQQPSDEYENGVVMMVTETGYKLHDRVVRPTKVIVSTGPGG